MSEIKKVDMNAVEVINLNYGNPENTADKKFFMLRLFLDKSMTLIETGTHLGLTSFRGSLFAKYVHTAEIESRFHEEAKKRCKGVENISFHLMSSDKMLLDIASGKIPAEPPFVFWLDAHLGNSDLELAQQILRKELEVIKNNFNKDDIAALLIDDTSGLTMAPDLINIQDCMEMLLDINPNFRISSTFRGGEYKGPTPFDADVLFAYDADKFDMFLSRRRG